MGTPTPPPPVPGDACAAGDGVLYPVGVPPRFLEIEIAGMEKCPLCPFDPPNGTWWFEQREGVPCNWELIDSRFDMFVSLLGGLTTGSIHNSGLPTVWRYFTDAIAGLQSVLTNEWQVCGGTVAAINGTMTIHWPGP